MERPVRSGELDEEIDLSRPEAAARYDELPLWSAPFGQLILERVPLRQRQRMLDIGAGTGFLTVELAQRCRSGTVVAVDPWTAAMAVLGTKCDYLGLTNVELGIRDAADLGLPDDSVDVAVSNLGINNFDDPAAVLAECRRVLRPGGALLLTSNLVGHMAEFYADFEAVLVDLGHRSLLPALHREIGHRSTVATTIDRLQHAGFEVTEVATTSFRMRYADGTSLLRHHFIRLGFLPSWRDIVDAPLRPTVFAELERRLNDRAGRDGSLDLTIPAACFTAAPRTGRWPR